MEKSKTDHETVFVDGTKLESGAGRYTFCWRESVEKHLAKIHEKPQEATGLKRLKACWNIWSKAEKAFLLFMGTASGKARNSGTGNL